MRGVVACLMGAGLVGSGGCFPPPHLKDTAEVESEVESEVASEVEPEVASEVASEVELEVAECSVAEDCGRLAGTCRKLLCIHGTCATEPAEGAPCDDGVSCTQNDTCDGYVCAGMAYTCDDGIACTDNACDGQGGCDYPAASGFCHIGADCIAAGTVQADDPCRVCVAGEAWSPNDGAPCEDGDACTLGDRCVADRCSAGALPLDAPGDWSTQVGAGQFFRAKAFARADGGLHIATSFKNGEVLGISNGDQWRTVSFALDAVGTLPPSYAWTDSSLLGERTLVAPVTGTLDALLGFSAAGPVELQWLNGLETVLPGETNSLAVIARVAGDGASEPIVRKWRVLPGDSGTGSILLLGLDASTLGACASFGYRGGGVDVPLGELVSVASPTGPMGVTAALTSDGRARWAAASLAAGDISARRGVLGCVVVGQMVREGDIETPFGPEHLEAKLGLFAFWWNDDGLVERHAPLVALESDALVASVQTARLMPDDGIVLGFALTPATLSTPSAHAFLGLNAVAIEATQHTAFVARFAPDGTLLWARPMSLGKDGFLGQLGLGRDAIWFGGSVDTSGTVGGAAGTLATLVTQQPGVDGFIGRYALDGTLEWAEIVAQGSGEQRVHVLAESPNGGVLIVGEMQGETIVGSAEVRATLRAVDRALFAARLDSAGGVTCRAH